MGSSPQPCATPISFHLSNEVASTFCTPLTMTNRSNSLHWWRLRRKLIILSVLYLVCNHYLYCLINWKSFCRNKSRFQRERRNDCCSVEIAVWLWYYSEQVPHLAPPHNNSEHRVPLSSFRWRKAWFSPPKWLHSIKCRMFHSINMDNGIISDACIMYAVFLKQQQQHEHQRIVANHTQSIIVIINCHEKKMFAAYFMRKWSISFVKLFVMHIQNNNLPISMAFRQKFKTPSHTINISPQPLQYS